MKLCTSHTDIADAFVAFYSKLYTSRVDYGKEAVEKYLAPIPLLELPGEVAGELDLPLMVEEVISAIRSLN